MPILNRCRVCLFQNVKLHTLNTTLLKVFEKMSDLTLGIDEMPQQLCYICLAHLRKSTDFIVKAQQSNHLLMQVISSGISRDSLTELERQVDLLDQTLSIKTLENINIDTESTDEEQEKDIKCEDVLEEILENSFKESEDIPLTFEADDVKPSICDYTPSSDSDYEEPLKKRHVKRSKRIRIKLEQREEVNEKDEDEYNWQVITLTKEEQIEEIKRRETSLNYINSPYKCELCFKGFIDVRTYNSHKDKHNEAIGPYECEICKLRYKTKRQWQHHNVNSHLRQYRCKICSHLSHTANQAKQHQNWHRGFMFECQLCGLKFVKSTSYFSHLRKLHPSEDICEVCGDRFLGAYGLKMHKNKTHKPEEMVPNALEPAKERFCSECNIQFISINAYKLHFVKSNRHTTHIEKETKCKICHEDIPQGRGVDHFRQHVKSLVGKKDKFKSITDKKTPCDQCNKEFLNRTTLMAHVKRMHLGLKYNKNIVCEVCGKKFASNATLKYHQRTHTGERPYSCTVCSKNFSDKNQLIIHTRSHTGEKPYYCSVCGKRFSQKMALNRHYRIHTGAKPYECRLCSKTFNQSSSLKLHIRTVHWKIPASKKNKTQKNIETMKIDDICPKEGYYFEK